MNCVYVLNTDFFESDATGSRNSLREYLEGCFLATEDDNRFVDGELADLLNRAHYSKVCSFFDRDERVFNWHYTMYARDDDSSEPVNAIASIVSGEKVVRGPVVITKDCPETLWSSLVTEMDVDKLAATLWWYKQSGRSARDEFGERTLIRMLADGSM
ncbi:hypothetical protein PENSPDRAFT_680643 [Peniophora sp. CONT]|nr:hypothetical protein PENSPDRAFT_680643 [Peniophora sp. CONT]